ncbi:MAG: HlyD family efflux transporter periplasmic adaptor subunit [Gammaproteobacteria bacterium]|nr:HlyD family efflux transporter periplasmic adaptor subunit [Gammaproteobacteria bacterium]
MNNFQCIWLAALVVGLAGCGDATGQSVAEHSVSEHSGHGEAAEVEPAKGVHGGRLLIDEDFTLELSIFEGNVPPEFRVWVTNKGAPVAPADVRLEVTLTRLGGIKNKIAFRQQDDFLRGDTVIYEPHSFVVTIEAQHAGQVHRWQYDNFEGRTRIGSEIAQAFGVETENAGSATIKDTVAVYGRVVLNTEMVRVVSARFDGVIQSVNVSIGDTVRKGQALTTIESNESLKNYTITAPIGGLVTERFGNPGEQTAARPLFTITDNSTVWVELAVFPAGRMGVRPGATVTVETSDGAIKREGVIDRLNTTVEANQSVLARVVLENADGALLPGMYLTGEIEIAEHTVPLAVKRSGLQAFRDFTVVYAQIGDEYEVRMLELGRQDEQWVEVLGGLDPGTRYVTTNSYLIKADVEKSGASHDH